MFVYTAKLNRKKAVITLIVGAIALAAVIFIAGGAGKNAVKTNEDRVKYLTDLGWEVCSEPVEQQDIVIPKNMDDVYTDYNEIQKNQGFDLTKYAGQDAERYTYEVKNYPGIPENVYADIIICRDKVIAGDIQSKAIDGFMQGLGFPE